MSCTEKEKGTRTTSFGWQSVDGRIEHHAVSVLSIQVTPQENGARFVEIVENDRVVFGRTLSAVAASDLAKLLSVA